LLSDHRPIIVSLGRDRRVDQHRFKISKRLPRWTTSRLDVDRIEAGALTATWIPISDNLDAENFISRLTEILMDEICLYK